MYKGFKSVASRRKQRVSKALLDVNYESSKIRARAAWRNIASHPEGYQESGLSVSYSWCFSQPQLYQTGIS